MDFEFDDDQRIIKETIDRFVADRYSFQKRKEYLESATGWSRAVWQELAELGMLGLPFDEAHGGGRVAEEVARCTVRAHTEFVRRIARVDGVTCRPR